MKKSFAAICLLAANYCYAVKLEAGAAASYPAAAPVVEAIVDAVEAIPKAEAPAAIGDAAVEGAAIAAL